MSMKKTAARRKKTKAKDEKKEFVVLFDEQQSETSEVEDENGSDADGSFVVMLDDPAADANTPTNNDDGSFVVMLDDETPPAVAGGTGDDEYFVVLLDDEESSASVVTQPEVGVFNVVLPGDFRMQKVVSLKPELVATLGASSVVYDASRVALADTASIQLVAAHLAALKLADASVEWAGASVEFSTTARILGFDFSISEEAPEVEAESAAA